MGWCYSASPTWIMPSASILQPNRSTTPSFNSSPENAATATREKHAARGIHFEGDIMADCKCFEGGFDSAFLDINTCMYIYIYIWKEACPYLTEKFTLTVVLCSLEKNS